MTLFKWIDELFTKKRPWDSFSEEEQKKFSPFMVNRYLSMNNDYLITLLVSFFGILMLSMFWFSNIFYIIVEKRKIERSKLLND